MEIKKIACLGSGVIGSSWAVGFVQHGYPTVLYDVEQKFLDKAKENVHGMFENLAKYGGIDAAKIPEYEALISYTTSLEEAVKDVQLIQENVPENYEIKWQVIEQLEQYAPADAIYASSTSGLLISEISKNAKHPERFIGAHPYNPPHLIPLVEITKSDKTDDKYVQAAKQFYLDCKKEPIVLKKELLGFISNRIQQAVWREMCEIVMRGACTFEDADKAVTFGPGLRWGIMGPGLIFRLGAGREGTGFNHPGMINSVNLWLDDMASWKRFPDEWRNEIAPQGQEEEMAARPAELGNDYDSLAAYRDEKLVQLLKMHGKL